MTQMKKLIENICGNKENVCYKYCPLFLNPLPKQQILDSSRLKEYADDYFKFDEHGRKFSKRVENTAGRGEIAHYQQFRLFPQCFQRTSTADT